VCDILPQIIEQTVVRTDNLFTQLDNNDMKKIITACIVAIVPVTSIAASVSLDTAGRCYEATRQSTQMAMLLDPNAAEYKILTVMPKNYLAHSPVASAKRTQRKFGMPGRPFWIMPEWKAAWLNLMVIGK
jgi:hypothetical protein